MTLVVQAPATYEPERRYILGVVLADWLGLDWRLEIRERSDVRITLEGEPGGVVLPDALFATAADEWLKPASYPRLPLPRASVSASGSDAPIAGPLPILYGSPAPGSAVMVHDGESVHPADPGRTRPRRGGKVSWLTGYVRNVGNGVGGRSRPCRPTPGTHTT